MSNHIGKICPYCKTAFTPEDDVVMCSACEMPHHKDCWIENKGCTTFGCTGTIENLNITPPPPPAPLVNRGFAANATANRLVFCTRCGAQNPANAAFCGRCGTRREPAAVFCTRCGTRNPGTAGFCSRCGNRLTGGR